MRRFTEIFPRKMELPEALREFAGQDHLGAILRAAADRIEELQRQHMESDERDELQRRLSRLVD